MLFEINYLTIWLGSDVYHPDAFSGLRKMRFVLNLPIWLGSDVYHPDAFLGLRKMRFVLNLPIWWGSDVYRPDAFLGLRKMRFVLNLPIWWGSDVYHPDAFLGLRKMRFVLNLPIWWGNDVYHPDAFLGLRKMHFVHYLTIWWGSDVYHPDAFFGTEGNAFCPLSHHMILESCLSPMVQDFLPSTVGAPHRFAPNPCQAVEQQVPWFEVTWPFSTYGSFGCFFPPGEKASTPSTLDEIHIGPLRCGSALGTLRCALRVAAGLRAEVIGMNEALVCLTVRCLGSPGNYWKFGFAISNSRETPTVSNSF